MTLRQVGRAALLLGVSWFAVATTTSALPNDQTPDLTSLSDVDVNTIVIHMERMGCYGTCPAYTVAIHGDGRVEYSGKNHVKEKSAREGRVETAAIKTLLSEFARTKFLSLPEEYAEEKCRRYCTDMATVVTELTVKGKTYRVKHYYGCAAWPREFLDLESAIDRAANTQQWTGDVSKAGPFGTTCWGG